MTLDVYGLLDAWNSKHASRADAEAAFRRWYTESIDVNGAPMALTELVDIAERIQTDHPEIVREVIDVFSTDEKAVLALRMAGKRIIDLFTLTDGRVSAILSVAAPDEPFQPPV